MKIRIFFLVLLIFTFDLVSPSYCIAQDSSKMLIYREAIETIVQEIDSAYNAQDYSRFSSIFTEDGNFQFPIEGIVMNGRNEIRQYFARQFANLPPLRHVTTTGDINVIGPGILAVDIQVYIKNLDPKTGAIQTLFHYYGLSIGILTDLGWHIRLVRLYPVSL